MNVLERYPPLYIYPFPSKYILGVAFYFYVKNGLYDFNSNRLIKRDRLLWFPAIIYGGLQLYWFSIAVVEDSYRIVAKLVIAGFFRVNEFVFLLFSIILLLSIVRSISKKKKKATSEKEKKNAAWLLLFTKAFLSVLLLNFVLSILDLIVHDGDDTMLFNYPHLIVNSAFIYWIGYIGFMKPDRFIIKSKLNQEIELLPAGAEIENKLREAMEIDQVYKNMNLSLPELAISLQISPKDLSNFINSTYKVNFSEYLNQYRIELVKTLIAGPDSKKYTLTALAHEAGFTSKSTFNAVFKKQVGMTPSQYRAEHHQKSH